MVALVKFLALLFVELYTVAAEFESTLQLNLHSAAQWGNKSHQTKSIFGLLRTSCAFVECIQTAGLDCEGFKKSSALVKFLASQGFN